MAANEFEVQGSTTVSSDGNSGDFTVPTQTMGNVTLDFGTITGTGVTGVFKLQAKMGDGNYYDVPLDQRKETGAADGGTPEAAYGDQADICGGVLDESKDDSLFLGVYKHLPAGTYRVAWVIGGTTPSVAIDSIRFAGK